MTAKELKSRIKFESIDVGYSDAMLNGSLTLKASIQYDKNYSIGHERAMEELKERVVKMMMRQIYEDQRRDLIHPIMELFKIDPRNYNALAEVKKKILLAAKYQGS